MTIKAGCTVNTKKAGYIVLAKFLEPVLMAAPTEKSIIRVLHLFSGPKREGDLGYWFRKLGEHHDVTVEVVDVDYLHSSRRYGKGNLKMEDLQAKIKDDVEKGYYDVLHAGTPCSTWSVLRHKPLPGGRPGPRPLRTLKYPLGDDPSLDLTESGEVCMN